MQKISFKNHLKPAFTVKARITFIKEIESGQGVSYEHLFKSSKKTTLTVVSIGYGDGVKRSLCGKLM